MPIRNPPVDGSAQPFRSDQKVVLECRNADGSLCFDKPQPPARAMTFDEVYALYFVRHRDAPNSAGWSDLRAWLEEHSWTVRAKTW